MSIHPSKLELDEAALGHAAPAVDKHLESCEPCRHQLKELQAARFFMMRRPPRSTLFPCTPVSRRAPRRSSAWLIWPALAAASVLLIALARRPAEVRMKGSASLSLLDRKGQPVTAPRVGDEVELRIYPGPYHRALVIAVDEAGNQLPIFPVQGGGTETLSPGVELSARFQVTPGAVRLIAGFSDSEMSTSELVSQHVRAGLELREREIHPAP